MPRHFVLKRFRGKFKHTANSVAFRCCFISSFSVFVEQRVEGGIGGGRDIKQEGKSDPLSQTKHPVRFRDKGYTISHVTMNAMALLIDHLPVSIQLFPIHFYLFIHVFIYL